jgi:thiol:disulfide interchange protein DsbD
MMGSFPTSSLAGQERENSPNSSVELIPEVTAFRPGTPFTVAIGFKLDPGWHNYWRNAGDSGLPTTIEWSLPAGFQAGEIQWPTPHRIVNLPLVDYGYSDEAVLLVEITPPEGLNPGDRISLDARVDWLICETICLPAWAEVSAEVGITSEASVLDSDRAEFFRDARTKIPKVRDDWAFEAEVTESGYRLWVRPAGDQASLPDSVYFFPAETSIIDHPAPQTRSRVEDGLSLELASSPYAVQPVQMLRGVLLAEDGGSWAEGELVPALEVEVEVSGAPPAQGAADGATSPQQAGRTGEGGDVTLALALLFAFAGGMLLNLMPCVFPILSLKILGAVSQGGEDRGRIRNHGLVFAVGVIAAFLGLAGILIALRAGGAQLGWGFQLQSPLFVALMATLFFAIGLNLMGVFEVGTVLTRLGSKPGEPSGYGESFSSGILATFIATPCTAPFMGAALGFALTRPTAETLLVFGFLGLGMAVPYAVLSAAPGLLEKLPRPGPWMETFKNVLAFPMFATAIWLIWVFGQQTGIGGATYLLSGLLLVGAAGWMVGRWHRTDLRSGVVARVVSLVILALALFSVLRGSGQEGGLLPVEEGWNPFVQSEVDGLLAQGRPVFVDFTAAWCLTCQVNERVVLNTETVQEAFRSRNVTLFKADWTRQDPEITAALEELGRNGVPVYALYRGNQGEPPHLLPAILTEQIVLDALETVLAPDDPIP